MFPGVAWILFTSLNSTKMWRSSCFPTIWHSVSVLLVWENWPWHDWEASLSPIAAGNVREKGNVTLGTWIQEAERRDPLNQEKGWGLIGRSVMSKARIMVVCWKCKKRGSWASTRNKYYWEMSFVRFKTVLRFDKN